MTLNFVVLVEEFCRVASEMQQVTAINIASMARLKTMKIMLAQICKAIEMRQVELRQWCHSCSFFELFIVIVKTPSAILTKIVMPIVATLASPNAAAIPMPKPGKAMA